MKFAPTNHWTLRIEVQSASKLYHKLSLVNVTDTIVIWMQIFRKREREMSNIGHFVMM